MKQAPDYRLYPQVPRPGYALWLRGGVTLLILLCGGGLLLRSLLSPLLIASVIAGAAMFGLLALLLRVLTFQLNRHNAQCYAEATERVCQAWWREHRQTVALVESVLLGPACSTTDMMGELFTTDHQPPIPKASTEGAAIHLLQVHGADVALRERQLAVLLAMHWLEQKQSARSQPLRCYWQGTMPAWAAFVGQVALCNPMLELPERPEAWEGMRSLNAIIDLLQGAPTDARVLCAGCQSTPVSPDRPSPAGEAAFLWLLAPQGGVVIHRGEGYDADSECLASVGERALQQAKLTKPTPSCISFIQPDVDDVTATSWNIKQHVQDANFGAIADLQAPVALTLAARYAELQGEPCGWLADDPIHTLVLGIVEPYDADS
jgi:hypothetical protein